MSQDLCCSFCQQLPTLAQKGRIGSASKCPLCKQALWVTPGGATSRLLSEAERTAPQAALWPWLAGAGIGLMAAVCLLLWHYSFTAKTTESPRAVIAVEPPVAMPVVQETPRAEGPSAQVKLAPPMYAARAKPSWQPAVTPTVQAAAAVAGPERPIAPAVPSVKPASHAIDNDSLAVQLKGVPQVDLDPQYSRKTKEQIASIARGFAKETKKDRDAFVKRVKKEEPNLAGLPFLMGDACALSKEEAEVLAADSHAVRAGLAAAMKPGKYDKYETLYGPASISAAAAQAGGFWWEVRSGLWEAGAIPALQQILFAENRFFRLGLAQHLNEIKDRRATDVLVNRAVFDLDPEIRFLAVHALRGRPKDAYQAFLVKSLRYPWNAAALHSAEAIAALQMTELVPELVPMLDLPDPNRPYSALQEKGEPKVMIKELVRINHHRNCMLCHAPANMETATEIRALRRIPVGPVPSVQESLPPGNTTVYYSVDEGVTIVRADITYLRQDFSLMQKVDDHGKWPEMQRFDFLVRTREISTDELAKLPPAPAVSEYKQAVLFALRELTGKDAPPQARAWREVLKKAD